ncbi:MAG: restriction endonuclease subunit S [Prevotella sp.]|nr:restriction endonuclease subunit S [Prevotella sp.]
MKKDWEYKKIGEICEIINGFAFKSNKYVPQGIRVIRITNVQNGYIEDKDPKFYPFETTNEIERYLLKEGDLLISLTGNVGRVGRLPISMLPAALNQRVACLRKKDNKIGIQFLFHLLNSSYFEDKCIKHSKGAAQLNMSTVWLSNYTVPIPPLSEQKEIVEYLDSSFAKIDKLKENAAKNLEEAKALFQSALKDALEPKEGWEEKTLKEISIIYGNYGLSVSSIPYNGVRYLRITDITENGELNDDKVSADISSGKTQEELQEGDILFARTGATVGKTLIYRKEFGKCLFAGYLIRYRLNKDIVIPQFIHHFTHSSGYYKWVSSNQKAAAQPNIGAKVYNELKIHIPPLSEQQSIVSFLDSLNEKVNTLQQNYSRICDECDALKQAILRQVFE